MEGVRSTTESQWATTTTTTTTSTLPFYTSASLDETPPEQPDIDHDRSRGDCDERQELVSVKKKKADRILLKLCSRLHGRVEEQEKLLAAFRTSQDAAEGRSVVAIVRGGTATGKTAWIHSLKEHLRTENGTLFHWVSDRQSVLKIGPGFSDAFRWWVHDMLMWNESDLDRWKRQVMGPFESFELAMVLKYFPSLQHLFKADDIVNPADMNQEHRYNWTTFEKFLRVARSPDFPIVTVFEDFHWVEVTTLRWISDRMNGAQNEGTLFIFSYNSDFEDKGSTWYRELQGLRMKGYGLVEITLQNLDEEVTISA